MGVKKPPGGGLGRGRPGVGLGRGKVDEALLESR